MSYLLRYKILPFFYIHDAGLVIHSAEPFVDWYTRQKNSHLECRSISQKFICNLNLMFLTFNDDVEIVSAHLTLKKLTGALLEAAAT